LGPPHCDFTTTANPALALKKSLFFSLSLRWRIPHALDVLSAYRNMKHQLSTFRLVLGSILKGKTQFKHRPWKSSLFESWFCLQVNMIREKKSCVRVSPSSSGRTILKLWSELLSFRPSCAILIQNYTHQKFRYEDYSVLCYNAVFFEESHNTKDGSFRCIH
jgi:hypothetical protein